MLLDGGLERGKSEGGLCGLLLRKAKESNGEREKGRDYFHPRKEGGVSKMKKPQRSSQLPGQSLVNRSSVISFG